MSVFKLTEIPWAHHALVFEDGSIYNKATNTLFDRSSQRRIHLTLTEFTAYCRTGELPSPLVNQEHAVFHRPGDLIPVPYYWADRPGDELSNENWFSQDFQKGYLREPTAIHRVQRAYVAMFMDNAREFDGLWEISFETQFSGHGLSDDTLTQVRKTERDKLYRWRRKSSST